MWGHHPELRGVDRARRDDIVAAIRHGRGVRDPRDAALAAAIAQQLADATRRFTRLSRRWLVFHVAMIVATALLHPDPTLLAVEAAMLLLPLLAWKVALHRAETYERAAEANRQLALAFGYEVPELEEPATSLPRIASRKGAAAVALAFVLAAAVVIFAVGRREPVAAPARGSEVVPSQWLRAANDACARTGPPLSGFVVNGLPEEIDDETIVRLREMAAREQAALTAMLVAGVPRGYPTTATAWFERKILLEREAVRAHDRGDLRTRAAALALVVEAADVAARFFGVAGATQCSLRM